MDLLQLLMEIRPEVNFKDSNSFIEDGLLDSFDVLLLASLIEEKYKIEINHRLMIPENFESVDTILELIERCKQE